jgi:magnesium transporter
MIVQCVQITDTLQLKPLEAGEALEASRSPEARTWIDLQDFLPEELKEWLERLGVKGLTHQLCLEARDRPGFYPLRGEIFFAIPVLNETKDRREAPFVAFLCRENLLLTLHSGPLLSQKRKERARFSESWLADRSIPAFIAAVMIEQSLGNYQHVAKIRDQIRALDEQAHRDPDSVPLEELLDLRSALWLLATVINDQLPALQALARSDQHLSMHREAQEHLTCAVVNLQAGQGDAIRLDARIENLRSDIQMHSQEKTNHRLAVLTVFSAIFMPATLMAGIWGMNFEVMPGLKHPLGYAFALGSMVLIGVSMLLYFRRKGWFD